MGVAERSSNRVGLVPRARGMLLHPGRTWGKVAGEPATVGELMLGYAAPLAAIGPVCGTLGLLVFGAGIAGIRMKTPSLLETIGGGLIDFAFSLISAYLLALTISALAPLFGGRVDRVQALKLVVYAATAVWVAGVFALYPIFGFTVGLLGALYSLYALYLGLPLLMRAPGERALTYFAAVLICAGALAIGVRLATGFIL